MHAIRVRRESHARCVRRTNLESNRGRSALAPMMIKMYRGSSGSVLGKATSSLLRYFFCSNVHRTRARVLEQQSSAQSGGGAAAAGGGGGGSDGAGARPLNCTCSQQRFCTGRARVRRGSLQLIRAEKPSSVLQPRARLDS